MLGYGEQGHTQSTAPPLRGHQNFSDIGCDRTVAHGSKESDHRAIMHCDQRGPGAVPAPDRIPWTFDWRWPALDSREALNRWEVILVPWSNVHVGR